MPSSIAVDGTYVFWTDYGSGAVMRAFADGSGATTIATGQNGPVNIALDGEWVYFTNYNAGQVVRVPKTGGTATTIASGQSVPYGITAHAGCVYWTNQGDGSVWSAATGVGATADKRVFVSPINTSNLGGIAGADAICQADADQHGLSGTYYAWLSDSTTSPSQRFTRSLGNYKLVDGTVIASGWAGLTSGSLLSPINRTSSGNPFGVTLLMTGTNVDGTAYSSDSALSCDDYTSTSHGQWELGIQMTTNWWTYNGAAVCSGDFVSEHAWSVGLYCMEQ